MTVGFLYGAGAETLIFVTGTSGKYPKLFVSRQKNQSQLWIPRKPRKIGVWVSGAEIKPSAVDTRTAVWVSTPEKFSKIVLGKTRNFSGKFGGVSAPALYKNPAVTKTCHLSKKLFCSQPPQNTFFILFIFSLFLSPTSKIQKQHFFSNTLFDTPATFK